ncbi:hypothetical protein C5Y96_05650 [Blastopirellula marina]|uniref:Uncharacterized protein n=1 Tax=Blastopirellula marina TaxID=124 RepID=A0A2S8G4G6_9BACT|nr:MULTISPECIES: hypothetical protein [Pirellulaceae]PQO39338.1 hypothetical protein C5Y96_05650 [Blastopirellula marina]RCS55646.1 hypothetical protein DTL36_05660 [Bremerella cremea]
MPLERKRRGDRADIKLRDWNTIGEAVDVVQGGRAYLGGEELAYSRQSTIVHIYNGSGGNVDRHGVLGIDGILVTESDNANEFADRPSFEGTTPTTADHLGRFVVLLEPIADGAIGRACLVGLVIANVQINDANDTHAEVLNSSSVKLTSSRHGTARILYKPAGTGDKLCAVKIGHDPGDVIRNVSLTEAMGDTTAQQASFTFSNYSGGGIGHDPYNLWGNAATSMTGKVFWNASTFRWEFLDIHSCDAVT